ncbi:hypothetical protein [Vermiculatibacterium agrestimuris]|uniref:hypothetical protein n=1 Tax=Vermiculatibacterium agrestimuris TaxID=2941519 RepID=UPI002041991F|nr:hypothetical protein [Vermiculatibacterium agrestimuris]
MFEHCDCRDHVDVPVPPCSVPRPKGTRVPKGGKTGQVLTKCSDVDGDTGWTMPVTMEAVTKAVDDKVNAAMDDISSVLDAINGEVV